MYVCTYLCTYVRMYECTYMCICVFMYAFMHVHIYMYIYTYSHTYATYTMYRRDAAKIARVISCSQQVANKQSFDVFVLLPYIIVCTYV